MPLQGLYIHWSVYMARADDTSERIISAASRLFYGEGIGRVSMDAIADKAGVTKRTLYYHFKRQGRPRRRLSPWSRSAEPRAVRALVRRNGGRLGRQDPRHLPEPRQIGPASQVEGLRLPAYDGRARPYAGASGDQGRCRPQEEVR